MSREREARALICFILILFQIFSPVREDTKKQKKMTLECRRCPRRRSVLAPYSCLLCISPIPRALHVLHIRTERAYKLSAKMTIIKFIIFLF